METEGRQILSDIFWDGLEETLDGIDPFIEDSGRNESTYFRTKIIPDLVSQLINNSNTNQTRQELAYVRESIELNEIGVVICAFEDEIDGVELRPIDKKADGSVALMILVRPNVLAGLESREDREDLMDKFKRALLDASCEQRSLMSDQKFVPYSMV